MKKEFMDFLKTLMELNPEKTEELMTENIKNYIAALESGNTVEKKPLTENGKMILGYLQSAPTAPYKAKDIAEALGLSSRTVSGSIRKVCTDGYVEKAGSDPALYIITEKGKNFSIEENV